MATTKPPSAKGAYDPIKAVEGMFNGSVTRIGYALKDPADYGPSTKTVLAECAKRFHDALDDCEIQLLDAKWYLEHQLQKNRLSREAKARAAGTATKRKHDEIQDVNDEIRENEQSATKKVKVNDNGTEEDSQERAIPAEPAPEIMPVQVNGTKQPTEDPKDPSAVQKPAADKEQKPKEDRPTLPQAEPVEISKPAPKEPLPPDDFAKPTPQATPTGTNEDDFNFESMFGEPAGDAIGDSTKDDTEFNFEFTTDGPSNGLDGLGDQDPDSLDSLLPGLESYANQADDNFLNLGGMSNNKEANVSNPQDPNALPSFSNDFDLPDLGGSNVFDDYLNDNTTGGGGDGGNGGNFVDNIDLSDSALLDMDFDSLY